MSASGPSGPLVYFVEKIASVDLDQLASDEATCSR